MSFHTIENRYSGLAEKQPAGLLKNSRMHGERYHEE
jgi:hypothetical protein